MTKTVATITAVAAAALLVLSACSEGDKKPVTPARPPAEKPEAIRNTKLLTEPKEVDVFKITKKAADFPGLTVRTLKQGEGEDTLGERETGSFHLVGKLANGKEFQNTKKSGAPQDILMMEWGHMPGLVVGVLGMKKGEIRSIKIPPECGYGERGAPVEGVPAHATVFLRAELVQIKDELPAEFLVRRTAEGTGDALRLGQTGSFHYTGILTSGDRAGEQFDTSHQPGHNPFKMQVGVGGAIEGWLKGGLGMRVGEKRWLRIPPKMAYGAKGSPPSIPPDATLIFEMELVSID